VKTLLLVDGSSYLYRAFHALPDLRTAAGEPTGAIRGFVGMLRVLREQVPADYLACVFDAKGRTFRDDLYADYKANRTAMPDDLARQIAPIHEVVEALGWPILEIEGIEADDVIGILARQAQERGLRTVISTGDKDLAQLVSDRVTLVNTMSNETLDVAGVREKFGVEPRQIVDYLTLVGDSVDNVPGVEKVGPKTAAKWLQQYGSLEGVIAAAASMEGKIGENLRKALPWLPTARTLVTIRSDGDLSQQVPDLESLRVREVDSAKVHDLFTRWEFRALLRDAPAVPAAAAPAATPVASPTAAPVAASAEYETLLDMEQFDAWLQRLDAAPVSSISVAYTGPDPMQGRLVGIALAVESGRACYVPLAHRYAAAPAQLAQAIVLERLKPWMESDQHKKLGHQLKRAAHVLANHGLRLGGTAHDTLLESYVLEPHRNHDLADLAQRHLGRKAVTLEDVCGKGAGRIEVDAVPLESATPYAAGEAEIVQALHRTLWPRIEEHEPLRFIYGELEIPVSKILFEMERTGVLIDRDALARQSAELGRRILELEERAHSLAGQPFNLGSPKQIGEILFGKLMLPVVKKTASGAPSTDEEVLEKLALDYPLPKALLEHRGLAKLKSTYCDKLPASINPATGRVHTSYGQAVAVTGRLSSSEPNLQNIPIRTPEGRRIREAFIAPPGSWILSADYSQIELRIMAHISGDTGLLAAFTAGEDIHRATASEVFGVPLGEVSAEQRRYAKVINFGLIYGMSAFGLASNLGIDRETAKNFIERYFTRYPGVARYMERTRVLAKQNGYVETVFGRRLWLAEINSPNGPRRQAAERAAINAPMQGTAADLIKLAMIAVSRWLHEDKRRTRLIMQVHDELVFEVPDVELDAVRERVPRLMCEVAELKVPLVADVGVGANWDEAH